MTTSCIWSGITLRVAGAIPLQLKGERIAFVVALVVVTPLAGCTGSFDATVSTSTSIYANEPFLVRPVDRRRFEERYRPTRVANTTGEPPGSIVVDTEQKLLFYVENRKVALRYGVGVGAAGKSWKGAASVDRKATWPAWYPTDEMRSDAPGIPRRIPPGADNPLGARALYLYQNGRDTLYRIHGTTEPWTIGTEASSGCIRMVNEDVIDLYARVRPGARVVVL